MTTLELGWQGDLFLSLEQLHIRLQGQKELKDSAFEIKQILDDLKDPPIVMVFGEFNAGKSTFINALLGEKVLTSDITPATATVTKISYGENIELIGHFHDGKRKVLQWEWLEQLSAERTGDATALRQSLYYLEIKHPHPLLKKMTLVDSPGLNSGYDHHTAATKMFMNRADVAVWLFSYLNVGLLSELESIKQLISHHLKPIGIINAIDQHDEEQEPLEDYLDYTKTRRLQGILDTVIGISAKEALDGQLTNDQELFELSNFQEALDALTSIQQDGSVKQKMVFERLTQQLNKLTNFISKKKSTLKNQQLLPIVSRITRNVPHFEEHYIPTNEKYIALCNALKKLNKLFNQPIKSLHHLETEMSAFMQLIKEMDIPSFQYDTLIEKWKKVIQDYSELETSLVEYNLKRNALENFSIELQQEWKEYSYTRGKNLKTIKAIQEKNRQFNENFQEVESMKNQYMKIRSKAKQVSDKYIKQLELKVNELYTKGYEEASMLKDKWNLQLSKIERDFNSVKYSNIYELHLIGGLQNDLVQALNPLFKHSIQSTEFERLHNVFKKLTEQNIAIPFEMFDQAYQTYKKWQPLSLSLPSEKKSKGVAIYNRSVLFPSSLPAKLDADLEGEINSLELAISKRRFSRIAIVATIVIIGFIVTSNMMKNTNESAIEEEIDSYEVEDEMVIEETAVDAEPVEETLTIANLSDSDISTYLTDLHEHMKGESALLNGFYGFRGNPAFDSYQEFYNGVKGKLPEFEVEFEIVTINRTDQTEITINVKEQFESTDELFNKTQDYDVTYGLSMDEDEKLYLSSFQYQLLDESEELLFDLNEQVLYSFFNSYLDTLEVEMSNGITSSLSKYYSSEALVDKELNPFEVNHGEEHSVEAQNLTIQDYYLEDKNIRVTTSETYLKINHVNQEQIQYVLQKDYVLSPATSELGFIIDDVTIISNSEEVLHEASTVQLTNEEEVISFIDRFRTAYFNAVNERDFQIVSPFFDETGNALQQEKQRFEELIAEFKDAQINTLTIEQAETYSDYNYSVQSTEDIHYHKHDGRKVEKTIQFDYSVTVTNEGELLIKDILYEYILRNVILVEEVNE